MLGQLLIFQLINPPITPTLNMLNIENCQDVNYVFIDGTEGCHYDNLRYEQWKQSCNHDNCW